MSCERNDVFTISTNIKYWAPAAEKRPSGMRQKYFGTGETFLFMFKASGDLVKFDWVGKDESGDENAAEVKKDRARELFLREHSVVTPLS